VRRTIVSRYRRGNAGADASVAPIPMPSIAGFSFVSACHARLSAGGGPKLGLCGPRRQSGSTVRAIPPPQRNGKTKPNGKAQRFQRTQAEVRQMPDVGLGRT
jgi:hypothetical protein